ncbi:hypothetical protein [Allomuricauda sp. M10]|uniref:hypothetical protein n=1 Tax=Allomuricauda sp. M10 TaxID=2683292 RepID=UPI001D18629A|nr:hypothetical protein [Muricauda sp. M10]
MEQVNAIIRRYYNLDPDKLSDEQWARIYNEFLYTEEIRLTNLKNVFTAALTKVLNEAFG